MHTVLVTCLLLGAADPLPFGKSTMQIHHGDETVTLYTYKPKTFRNGPMLMVFHGVLANAEEYRDHAMAMGDRFGALVVAPLFDKQTFPIPRYQFGGIVVNGKATPPQERTGEYVNRIAREIRKREDRTDMPYALIGHSGGGQFLVRVAAFVKTDAQRIVISNPGTYVFPTRSADFPFGFGGLPAELQSDDVLKAYLAQPVTLYVGSKDVERDEHLDITPPAEKQGATRFERSQNFFKAMQNLAKEKSWPFHWKMLIAEGIEHDHEKMFNNELCAEALGWKEVGK